MQAHGVRIAGLIGSVPKRIEESANWTGAFGESEVEKIVKMTGIAARRVVEKDVCTSDLCVAAAEDLLARLGWERESVDLLVFVSQTGDYMLPATACVAHGRLGLASHCAAFDLTLGCSGFVYGLWAVASILACGGAKRALLLVGDTISKVTSPGDRATVLLFGDAGSATALEHDPSAPPMSFVMSSDGKGQNHLIVPAGGFRNPSTAETCVRTERADGSVRSEEDLYMNGAELLAYTLACVPKLIRETLAAAGREVADVDYYVFHQANKFMIEHFARKAGVPMDRVPLNLDRYGNTSSASVPLVIASELAEAVATGKKTILGAGFGVGYSAGGAVFEVGPCPHVGLIEV
jgi:3-oxoacyl-[acyl-carrier-protein] synthase-3